MSLKSKFDNKTAKKYAIVYRPHDDPDFYDNHTSEHVLVPVENSNQKKSLSVSSRAPHIISQVKGNTNGHSKSHVSDTNIHNSYDYTKHLKPIGLDPDNSVFIPAKSSYNVTKSKNIGDLFVEPKYQNLKLKNESMFHKGMAKEKYLTQMQNISDKIKGFQPDMDPALREVLEALDDDAYVVNDDRIINFNRQKKTEKANHEAENTDDEIFDELLKSGEVEDSQSIDNWNFDDFEDQQYEHEMLQFDNIENLNDLQTIDYQSDVRRFKKEKEKFHENSEKWDSDNESDLSQDSLHDLGEMENEDDKLGELPSINTGKSTNKMRKQRRKKGAMSDVSGFSMSSSAIARTEVMSILDDKYDHIISGYENYEEEQKKDELNTYKPFDMSQERPDFEAMIDDFLDNYELEKGGRNLVKKNKEIDRLKEAADEVSKGKLSMRRKMKKEVNDINAINNSLNSLKF